MGKQRLCLVRKMQTREVILFTSGRTILKSHLFSSSERKEKDQQDPGEMNQSTRLTEEAELARSCVTQNPSRVTSTTTTVTTI